MSASAASSSITGAARRNRDLSSTTSSSSHGPYAVPSKVAPHSIPSSPPAAWPLPGPRGSSLLDMSLRRAGTSRPILAKERPSGITGGDDFEKRATPLHRLNATSAKRADIRKCPTPISGLPRLWWGDGNRRSGLLSIPPCWIDDARESGAMVISCRSISRTRFSLDEGMTPLIEGSLAGRDVLFKIDALMPTGSFKDRGAATLLAPAPRAHSATTAWSSTLPATLRQRSSGYSAAGGLECSRLRARHHLAGQAGAIARLRRVGHPGGRDPRGCRARRSGCRCHRPDRLLRQPQLAPGLRRRGQDLDAGSLGATWAAISPPPAWSRPAAAARSSAPGAASRLFPASQHADRGPAERLRTDRIGGPDVARSDR